MSVEGSRWSENLTLRHI